MNEKLTLQELIDALAARHQMEPEDADAFVKAFWALIEEGLKSDNYVKIRGLGTFKLIDTEARESINIQTGERIEIQSHARITFTPEASLRDQINRPFSHFETVVLNESTNFDDLVDSGVTDDTEENDDKLEQEDDNVAILDMNEPSSEVNHIQTETNEITDVADGASSQPDEISTEENHVQLEDTISEESTLETEVKTTVEETDSLVEGFSQQVEFNQSEESEQSEGLEQSEVAEQLDELKRSKESELSVVTEATETTEKVGVVDSPESPTAITQDYPNDKEIYLGNQHSDVQEEVSETICGTSLKENENALHSTTVDHSEDAKSIKERLKQSKRRLSWCVILCALLAGIVIGGFTSFVILLRNSNLADSTAKEVTLIESESEPENASVSAASVDSSAVDSDIFSSSEDTLTAVPSVVPVKTTADVNTPVASVSRESHATPRRRVQEKRQEQSLNVGAQSQNKKFSEKINYKIVGTIATHTLRSGETLNRIALKYYRNKKMWPYLVTHNVDVIKNPDNVPIGTTLKIPKLVPGSSDKP